MQCVASGRIAVRHYPDTVTGQPCGTHGWMDVGDVWCPVHAPWSAASVSRLRPALLWETMRAKEAREENQRVYGSEHTKVA